MTAAQWEAMARDRIATFVELVLQNSNPPAESLFAADLRIWVDRLREHEEAAA